MRRTVLAGLVFDYGVGYCRGVLHIDRNLSIVAVAERSGSSSAKHLSVAFRNQIGMSPSAYRDRFRCRPRS